MKTVAFVSHELACPGTSWLSRFCAFWFKCSLTYLFLTMPHLLGLTLQLFAELLTQVAEGIRVSGRIFAHFYAKVKPQRLHNSETLKLSPLLLKFLEGSMTP